MTTASNKKPSTIRTSSGIIHTTGPLQAVTDAITSAEKGFGTASDPSWTSAYAPNVLSRSYAELAASYEYWIPRKLVDLIPDEAMSKKWTHVCPSMSQEQLDKMIEFDKKLQVREKFRTAWKWERLFGFGMVVMLFDESLGLFREPIEPDQVKEGSLIGLQVYDPQQSFPAEVEFLNLASPNFRQPTNYTLGTPGYMAVNPDGVTPGNVTEAALIHHSRCLRLTGLDLPWYTRQNNFYHGQGVVASMNDIISRCDLVIQSVAQLLFKLSVPVFKTPRLRDIIGDGEIKQAFLERMSLVNTMMSNNHMAIIDKEEELENLEQSGIGGMDAIIERFFKILASAANIPHSKFLSEQPSGITNTGESDRNNWYDTCEAERANRVEGQIDRYYDFAFPALLGIERPKDHEVVWPPLHQLSMKEKAELSDIAVGTLSKLFEDGVINRRIYIEEIRERDIVSNISDEDQQEILEESSLADQELQAALSFSGTDNSLDTDNPGPNDEQKSNTANK